MRLLAISAAMKAQLICAVLLALVVALPAAAAEPLKLVYGEDYPPISYLENGKMTGIDIDVLEEALHKRMGVPLQHAFYPWARAQQVIQAGGADGFITQLTPARLAALVPGSAPILDIPQHAFTVKTHPALAALRRVNSLPGLAGYQVVTYIGNGWVKTHLQGLNVDYTLSLETTLRRLAALHGDVTVDNDFVVDYYSRRLGLAGQLEQLPLQIDSARFYLLIRKESPYAALMPRIDETLAQMRKDGTLQAIIRRYVPTYAQ
ncbi:substrate-binding periplasmic protein [Andreprevotia chitinilytica]|uniref:substrate-binding periplasmic protein n=1 Tax=Andreprevotia chitinilytica TaxID=396808 RepID=UPI00054E335E|nr:transporter substrate-binding domain-containing protein [Andreprevotia chitinilytica]